MPIPRPPGLNDRPDLQQVLGGLLQEGGLRSGRPQAPPDYNSMSQEALLNAFNNAGQGRAREALRSVIEKRSALNYQPGKTTAEPIKDKYPDQGGLGMFQKLSNLLFGVNEDRRREQLPKSRYQ